MPPTTYRLNAPVDHPDPHELPEITIIDPTHPLFGHRFPLVSRVSSPSFPDHVFVAYGSAIHLRIPVTATSLIPQLPATRTKLTISGIQELVTLATQWEVLWPSTPTPSGVNSPPNSKSKSKTSSRSSSRR